MLARAGICLLKLAQVLGVPHNWTLTLLSSKLPLLTGTWLYCAMASFKFLSCCKVCGLAVTSSCSGSRASSRLLQMDGMGSP